MRLDTRLPVKWVRCLSVHLLLPEQSCVCILCMQEHGLVVSRLGPEQKVLLLQIALKSADLGHAAEDLDVHLRYAASGCICTRAIGGATFA